MVIVISFQRFKRQSLKDQEYSFIQPFEMHLANLTQLTFNAKDMTRQKDPVSLITSLIS